ncbi:MAG: RNA polymerase sporulation sigma factor SigE [Oscillospiraceae bacterium]|jgi:RNA polymerase sporulation-specific sigma factor|nr:RNA polymerase sporulation sigma factor SigE [Oscillospiraceae bacterium]
MAIPRQRIERDGAKIGYDEEDSGMINPMDKTALTNLPMWRVWLNTIKRAFINGSLDAFDPAVDVEYIGGSDILPAPLSREEEETLVQDLRGDNGAIRTRLIEHNLRLVVYIARRFENTGVGLEDLISIGTIGLIKAVNTFDPVKKIKLATYASRCIENEILMHLRRTSRLRLEVSFDEPLNTDWDGNELLLSDILGTESDMVYRQIEEGVEKQLLESALTRLNPREQRIMKLRFGLGGANERTQKEVADILGISQSYISRLEKRILFRLKKELARMA